MTWGEFRHSGTPLVGENGKRVGFIDFAKWVTLCGKPDENPQEAYTLDNPTKSRPVGVCPACWTRFRAAAHAAEFPDPSMPDTDTLRGWVMATPTRPPRTSAPQGEEAVKLFPEAIQRTFPGINDRLPKHSLPHPGYRAGQVWAREDGLSTTLTTVAPDWVWTSAHGTGEPLHEFAREWPYLMADPACPHLAPWLPGRGKP
jgi:hypothetical protein